MAELEGRKSSSSKFGVFESSVSQNWSYYTKKFIFRPIPNVNDDLFDNILTLARLCG